MRGALGDEVLELGLGLGLGLGVRVRGALGDEVALILHRRGELHGVGQAVDRHNDAL